MSPSLREAIENIKTDLKTKVTSGLYKLVQSETRKGDIWKRFATITKTDGTVIGGYVCCTNCFNIFKLCQGDKPSNLYRHNCLLETNIKSEIIEPDNEQDSENMKDETLVTSMDSIERQIWQTFDLALIEKGNTVDGQVSCRQCKMVLKNDYSTKSQQKRHNCLDDVDG